MSGGFLVAANAIVLSGLAKFVESGNFSGQIPVLNACNTIQFERIKKVLGTWGKVCLRGADLDYLSRLLLIVAGLTVLGGSPVQDGITKAVEAEASSASSSRESSHEPSREVIGHVIDGLKEAERAQYLYERIERVETRRQAVDPDPQSVRVSRVIPAGTGIAKIQLGPDGKPSDVEAYRAELDKVLKALTWAVETGQTQREAYQKIQKKQKERDDLIDATRNAFLLTFVGQEARGDRMLSKYRMAPNPAFKPTNRATSIYTKVKGVLWVDEAAQQLAQVEGEVTDDISLGIFLAKIYKGSRFMQDRYEMAPGIWLPSFTQYDFDGRKFFSNISAHEKTFYSAYKRIGPPAEAIPQIQLELAHLDEMKAKPASEHRN